MISFLKKFKKYLDCVINVYIFVLIYLFMVEHKRVYFGYFGDGYQVCEVPWCGRVAVDVHHIDCRGIGGSVGKDEIDNLMGMCREHHDRMGDKKFWRDHLVIIHMRNIINFKKLSYVKEKR